MRLDGKSALVTGAASGFGAEIARRFVTEGANVVILDLDGAGAERVAGECGSRLIRFREMSRKERISSAPPAWRLITSGKPDVVVNNAGWTHRNKPLLEGTEEEFDRIHAINVKSIFLMTQAAAPLMIAQGGGCIINIGSTAGIRPRPGLTWYNTSKGAVNLGSKSMAVELAPSKIRVNCVAPVMGETGLLEAFMGMPDTPENRAKFIATVPLGRLARPSDIATTCVFLASDEAAFLTGVVLPVDGGRTI